MIQISDNHNCCGCSACATICPKQCISMVADNEGFLYPKVDEGACIDCNVCRTVCNELSPYEKREPLKVLAAINKNEEIRLRSSSGAIFYILAEKTIKDSGVVFGARFDENWQVVIDYAEDLRGVEAFMGSKYVEARMENAYKDTKRFLSEGRKVLFSGTPCQVAGLHKFLRKSYDNLLTVDFICHGTPSPKVWTMYLDDVIRQGRRISSVEFRNKVKGWKNFSFHLRYDEEDETTSMLSPFRQNHYMKAFLSDLILRPSCHDCKAKGCSSLSDLTIADFWGVQTVFPDMDDDKGTGLVFINTKKGHESLDFSKIQVRETTYDSIKPLNPACYRSVAPHPKRMFFFTRLGNEDLISLINDCTRQTKMQRLRMFVGRYKSLMHRILKTVMGGGKKICVVKDCKPFRTAIYTFPENPRIISVSFRNKEYGWKGYNMEIKIKGCSNK